MNTQEPKLIDQDEPLTILRDGEEVAKVTGEGELMRWFHKRHSFSMFHAVTYEGYKIIDSNGQEVLA